jgi:hypothetical protein
MGEKNPFFHAFLLFFKHFSKMSEKKYFFHAFYFFSRIFEKQTLYIVYQYSRFSALMPNETIIILPGGCWDGCMGCHTAHNMAAVT